MQRELKCFKAFDVEISTYILGFSNKKKKALQYLLYPNPQKIFLVIRDDECSKNKSCYIITGLVMAVWIWDLWILLI